MNMNSDDESSQERPQNLPKDDLPSTVPFVIPTRPSPSRIVRVVAGLSEWTSAEQLYVAAHPQITDYARRLRAAMDKFKTKSDDRRKFTERVGPEQENDGPPARG
jgi:hypothetical protein